MTDCEHIPVVDLFAGPGGLGEGFSSYLHNGQYPFSICLSVEKDERAWETLTLRAFFRQFRASGLQVPSEYYDHVMSPKTYTRDELFQKHPKQAKAAAAEAWCAELGDPAADEELRKAIPKRLKGHKRWVLIGGPPCQAYSIAGRSRNAQNTKFEDDERHFLYREYLKIIARHWPSVFVMENVKGMLSAKVKGNSIFPSICRDLKDPGKAVGTARTHQYRIFSLSVEGGSGELCSSDFVVRMEDYGIPQARHRVILLGIQNNFVRSESEAMKQMLPHYSKLYPIESILILPRLRSEMSQHALLPGIWSN